MNQLIECVMGKGCVLEGTFGDATPFRENSDKVAEEVCEKLKSFGFERTGTEVMYSGFTGEPLEVRMFIGPTYYQRLKHMSSDKIHSRASGHVTTLCRQPLEGAEVLFIVRLGALVKCKSFASPNTMGKTIGSGNLLKLLVLSLLRN